jgi:hypothetical protein
MLFSKRGLQLALSAPVRRNFTTTVSRRGDPLIGHVSTEGRYGTVKQLFKYN